MKLRNVSIVVALLGACAGNPGIPAHEAVVVTPKKTTVDVQFGNEKNGNSNDDRLPTIVTRFSSGWESMEVDDIAKAFNTTFSERGINAASFTYTVLSNEVAKSTFKTGQWFSNDLTVTQFSVLADDAFFLLASANDCGEVLLLIPSTKMFNAGSTSGFFDRVNESNACVEGSAPAAKSTNTTLLEVRAGEQLQLF